MGKRHHKGTAIGAAVWIFGSLLFAQSPIQYEISFYDQQVYLPGDSVQLRISLRNDSSQVFSFRLADERMFNLDFEVVNLRNVAQPASEKFTIARSSNQRVYFREISLNPGEEFSFVETLNDYRVLDEGVYVVRSHFYPDLVGPQTMKSFASNRLTLAIRPGYREQDRVILAAEQRTMEVLQAQAIPPDEVVSNLIEARMHNNREKFFLHLDVTALYRLDPRRDSQYRRLSEADQLTVLSSFESELWTPTIQDSISRVPLNYEILRTSYDSSSGTVEALQRYQMDSYVELKRFTYRLSRRDGVWFIVAYTVTNLGTE